MPIISSAEIDKHGDKVIQGQGREQAIALKYSKTDELPTVLARGRGDFAEYIKKIAAQYGIPIHKDATLAALLIDTDLGANVTPQAYRLLAEVISFLYEADRSIADKRNTDQSENNQPENGR